MQVSIDPAERRDASVGPPRGVVNPGPFAPGLIRRLERVEAEVWGAFYRLASDEDAAAFGLRRAPVGSGTLMAAAGLDVLFFNRVVGFGMGAPATEEGMDAIIDTYAASGVPRFFIQVSPAVAPAVCFDWLRRRGFRHYNNWMKLFRGVQDPPEVEVDLRIERIGPERAEAFAAMVAPAFGWPEAVGPWVARLVGRPEWHHYMAYDGDAPIATGGLYVNDGVGYLGPAATLPGHRQRGAQGALIARRIRDAAASGCTLLVTETAEDRPDRPAPSFRNLIRFGFETAYARPNYLYTF